MIRKYLYGNQPVYVQVCDYCQTSHMPPFPPARASQARAAAHTDGWQAPTSKKHRAQGRPDLCPACRYPAEPADEEEAA